MNIEQLPRVFFQIQPDRIRLELLNGDDQWNIQDIDGIYYRYFGISLYKDEQGYYTTPDRLTESDFSNLVNFLSKFKNFKFDNVNKTIRKPGQIIEITNLLSRWDDSEAFKFFNEFVEPLLALEAFRKDTYKLVKGERTDTLQFLPLTAFENIAVSKPQDNCIFILNTDTMFFSTLIDSNIL